MSNKYCNLIGANKVKDEYVKINDGFAAVQEDKNIQDNRLNDHVNGNAEKHSADKIIFDDSSKTKVIGHNVAAALDSIESELVNIVAGDANAEVGSAHVSSVKSKEFIDIDARFEEIEQDYMDHLGDKATIESKGHVKIGTNINVDESGTITVNDSSTTQKGVVQLYDGVDSDDITRAATANAISVVNNKAINPQNYIADNSIPSSKLKQAADTDKIQPANLSAQVIAMMNGQSPTGTTPTDGSVTTAKLANGAVTLSKLSSEVPAYFQGVFAGIGLMNFDTLTHMVTIPQHSRVISQKSAYGVELSAGGITLSMNATNIWIVGVNKTSNTWFVKNTFNEFLENDDILVATYWAGRVFMSGPFLMNGKTRLESACVETSHLVDSAVTTSKIADDTITSAKMNLPGGKVGIYIAGEPINFNFLNSQVEIPRYASVINGGSAYGYLNSAGTTLSITSPSARNLLILNTSTNEWSIKVGTPAFNLSKDDIIIAGFWPGLGHQVSMAGSFKVNGKYPGETNTPTITGLESKYGLYVGLGTINFNTAFATVNIPESGRVCSAKSEYGVVGAGGITLTLNNSNPWVFGVNKVSNTWFARPSTTWSLLTESDIIVGTYFASNAWVVGGNFAVNGITILKDNSVTTSKIVDGSVTLSKLGSDIPVASFVETNYRMLISPSVFLVKGVKLPIYKSSLFSTSQQNSIDTVKTYLSYIEEDGTPQYKHFTEDIDLDGSTLSNSFSLNMRPNILTTWYSQTIDKHYADPASKTQKPKIIMIGDSLTDNYIPKYTKDKLTALGIISSMHGTITNLGEEKGEGRPSWCYAHYIGRDTILGISPGTNQISPQPSGSTSNLNSNPFLKLATEQEKTDHPTWCFRNTGTFNELSYYEDSDKTGDFYIFDFDFYLTQHGLQEPDIVTIALGTNDINKAYVYNITGLESCRLGLEIMVKRIKEARPNIKVAIVPAPAWGNTTWDTNVSAWIENCIKDIETFALTDVYIVPVWAHMNRIFIFPHTSTTVTSTSKEIKNINSDAVHFDTPGRKQYANVMTSWIVNMLS